MRNNTRRTEVSIITSLRALCMHVSSAKRIAGSNEKISNDFSLREPVLRFLPSRSPTSFPQEGIPSELSPFLSISLHKHTHTPTHPSLTPSIYLSAPHLSSDSGASLRHDQAIVHGGMGWVRAHRILLPSSDAGLCGKVRRQVNKPGRVEHGSVVSTCPQPHTHTLL